MSNHKLTVAEVLALPPQRRWKAKPGRPGKQRESLVPVMPDDAAERFERGATEAEIMAASSTRAGAWTAVALAQFGIEYPPRKGWRAQLIANAHKNGRQ